MPAVPIGLANRAAYRAVGVETPPVLPPEDPQHHLRTLFAGPRRGERLTIEGFGDQVCANAAHGFPGSRKATRE